MIESLSIGSLSCEQAREMLPPFKSKHATEQEIAAKNERRRCVETQTRKVPKLAPCNRKPPTVLVTLPRADTHKCPRVEEGYDMAATSAPTPLRAEPSSSKGKGIEGSSPQQWFGELLALNEALGSPAAGISRES